MCVVFNHVLKWSKQKSSVHNHVIAILVKSEVMKYEGDEALLVAVRGS